MLLLLKSSVADSGCDGVVGGDQPLPAMVATVDRRMLRHKRAQQFPVCGVEVAVEVASCLVTPEIKKSLSFVSKLNLSLSWKQVS